MNSYLIAMLLLYVVSYCFYLLISRGLGHKAEYLQLRRFIPCAILAILPSALSNLNLLSLLFISSFFVGLLWIVTYPLLYFLTYRKNSSDFGFHLDVVFGLYIIGWLTGLKILIINFNFIPTITMPIISTIEFILLLIPIAQLAYYFLYGSCITENGITMIQETYWNETIEFFKSLPFLFNIATFSFLLFFYYAFIKANLISSSLLGKEVSFCFINVLKLQLTTPTSG